MINRFSNKNKHRQNSKMSLHLFCVYCRHRIPQTDYPHHLIGHLIAYELDAFPCNECFEWSGVGAASVDKHTNCAMREAERYGSWSTGARLQGNVHVAVIKCADCDYCVDDGAQLAKHFDWCHRKNACRLCKTQVGGGFIGLRIHWWRDCSNVPQPPVPIARQPPPIVPPPASLNRPVDPRLASKNRISYPPISIAPTTMGQQQKRRYSGEEEEATMEKKKRPKNAVEEKRPKESNYRRGGARLCFGCGLHTDRHEKATCPVLTVVARRRGRDRDLIEICFDCWTDGHQRGSRSCRANGRISVGTGYDLESEAGVEAFLNAVERGRRRGTRDGDGGGRTKK